MSYFESYNLVLFSQNRYVKLPCKKPFTNDNFDVILQEIGKLHYKNPDASVNRVCALLRDEINNAWHLNRLRNSKKKVSSNQIKSIRRSFNCLGNSAENFIRIPFDVASIIFFILNIVKSIDTPASIIHQYIEAMNQSSISDVLYYNHTKIFYSEYNTRIAHISDDAMLTQKYQRLHANLDGPYTFMSHTFSDLSKHNSADYRL